MAPRKEGGSCHWLAIEMEGLRAKRAERRLGADDSLDGFAERETRRMLGQAENDDAVQFLDLLLDYFADERRWKRGAYYDHGKRCLVGAIGYLGRRHRIGEIPERCGAAPVSRS